jgi:hypothetical protein
VWVSFFLTGGGAFLPLLADIHRELRRTRRELTLSPPWTRRSVGPVSGRLSLAS